MSVLSRLGELWARMQGPPKRRSPQEAIAILERELDGTGSVAEWDDFIGVPIEDAALEEVRRQLHFAGGELPESRALIERALATLRSREASHDDVAT